MNAARTQCASVVDGSASSPKVARRFQLVGGTLLLLFLAGLALAGPAFAAPTLGLVANHAPSTIGGSDERVLYTVALSNTATPPAEPQVGETYTCDPGSWQPTEAAAAPTFGYRWLRDGLPIPNTSTAIYKLTSADEGQLIQCQVTGANSNATTTELAAPIVVSPAPSPTPPEPVTPGGEGSRPIVTPDTESSEAVERTCSPPTGWSGAATWSYQWLLNGEVIPGATTASYLPTGDEGKVLQCEVLAESSTGAAASISSNNNVGSVINPPFNAETNSPALLGPSVTSGIITVSVALPRGVRFAGGSGAGWTCRSSAASCTSEQAVAPGDTFSPLTLEAWIFPEEAPVVVGALFTAFGGGSVEAATAQDSFARGLPATFGLTSFTAEAEDEASPPGEYTQAGGHPFSASTSFALSTHAAPNGNLIPVEALRDGFVNLPAGFIGNPQAVAGGCSVEQVTAHECPEADAVGGVSLVLAKANGGEQTATAVYKITPETGYPAEFAFRGSTTSSLTYVVRAKVRSDGDYGITAIIPLAPEGPALVAVKNFTFCTYGAKRHLELAFDAFKGCKKPGEEAGGGFTAANPVPFLTNPTRCTSQPLTSINVDSYEHPGARIDGFPDLSDSDWKSQSVASAIPTNCETLTEAWVGGGARPTEPSFTFQPEVTQADTPSGYSVDLHVPQDGLKEPDGLATADLDGTTVKLPAGVALSPSAANGLQACSEAQMGLTSESPLHFNLDEPKCPDGSKVGTLEVDTPLLEDPLTGSIYLAEQEANPFHSKFAVYLAVDDEKTGIVVKLAGRVAPDPVTGQITATFENNPQLPFEDFKLDFFGGSRASLVNPSTCGGYTTQTQLTPWSAVDPEHPTATETATPSDHFTIGSGPGGGACASTPQGRGFAPGLNAGVEGVGAGAHSPFVLRLTRNDGEQEFGSLDTTLPPGSAATLAGVPQCSDSAIVAAEHKSGKAEQANPSCPADTQVGTLTTTAGAGTTPYAVTGKAYLAGPYKGAPLSLVFITPAVAGPFDLGTVVVRAAAEVDPTNAQITVKTDAIPTILEGVPLQIRSIVARIDRPDFTINPTSCERMAVDATVAGSSGATASPSNSFQVSGCSALALTPKLTLKLSGGTRRAKYPQLTATLTQPGGQANLRFVRAVLPRSEFLAQEHIRTICTRVQFAEGNGNGSACPKGSVYGHAEAWSPLLGYKLSGPVFLRSNGGERELPDLLAALEGPEWQPIRIDLLGFVDSVHRKGQKAGGIRTTFATVPDAPVSRFVLRMGGGGKSLLRNSEDLCKATKAKRRATVRVIGQNNKRTDQFPLVQNQCHKKGKKKH